MARARGIRAGRAFVELGINDRVTRGIQRIEQRMRALGRRVRNVGVAMTAMAGAVATPLAAATRQFATAGDELDKMSARTGVSVEALSELSFAAQVAGTNIEAVAGAMQRMNRRIGRMTAGEGTASQVQAMEQLGLSIQQFEQMNPEQRFMALAEAMSRHGDAAEAAGLAQRAFGTSVDEMLPLLMQGAGGIEDLMQQARSLGLTIDTRTAEAAAKLTDALTVVRSMLRRTAMAIGEALAPMATRAAEAMQRVAGVVLNFAENNQELFRQIARVALIVGAIGGSLMALGLSIQVVAFAFGGLAMLIGGAVKAFGGLAKIMLGLVSVKTVVVGAITALGATIKTQTSAMGTAFAGLGNAFARVGGWIGDVLSWIGDTFGWVVDVGRQSFRAIASAMKGGDIQAAGRVLTTSIRLIWLRLTSSLRENWRQFQTWLAERWAGLVAAFRTAMNDITALVRRAGIRIVQLWDWAVQRVSGLIGNAMLRVQVFMEGGGEQELRRRLDHLAKQQEKADQARQAKIEQQLDDVDAAQRKKMEEIGEDYAAMLQGIGDAHAERMKEADKALESARSEWQEAMEQAKEAGEAWQDAPDFVGPARRLSESFDDMMGSLSRAADSGEQVRVAFAGADLTDLIGAGPSPEEREIKRLRQDTIREFRELTQAVRDGSALFGR